MIDIGIALSRTNTQNWWPDSASFAFDFVNNRYARNGAAIDSNSAFSLARASSKLANTVGGGWQVFAPNILSRTNNGALLEDVETYYPTNSALANASLGTLGSGGSLPALWGTSSSYFTPLTTIDEITTVNGLHALVFTIAGTNNSGGTSYPGVYITCPETVVQGETWTSAFSLSIDILGSDNVGNNLVSLQEWNGSTYLAASNHDFSASADRQETTRTLTNAAVTRARLVSSIKVQAGETLNRTYTLSIPTLTKSAILSSPLETTGAGTVLRAADDLTLHLPSGTHTLTINFDDDSQQVIGSVAGGDYLLPTNLNRPTVTDITGVSA